MSLSSELQWPWQKYKDSFLGLLNIQKVKKLIFYHFMIVVTSAQLCETLALEKGQGFISTFWDWQVCSSFFLCKQKNLVQSQDNDFKGLI